MLCQTLQENSYIDLVEATTFPISICHSPDDEIVPMSINAPSENVMDGSNKLLYSATIFNGLQKPTGTHVEAFLFCSVYQILQFSYFSQAPLAPLAVVVRTAATTTCGGDNNAGTIVSTSASCPRSGFSSWWGTALLSIVTIVIGWIIE